jgi:8-oxo-dGTP pyrophosphatase MutT (NUDIX family)
MTIRDRLREEIESLVPIDDREADSQRLTLDFLEQGETLFDESISEHHVTASAFVVSERGMILHLHRKLGIWVQPGGHIDEGESPQEAALRETLEETGLPVELASPISIFHVDVHPGPRGHTHYDIRYILTSPPVNPSPPPEESQEVHWFSFTEAFKRCDPSLQGAVLKLESEMASRALAN